MNTQHRARCCARENDAELRHAGDMIVCMRCGGVVRAEGGAPKALKMRTAKRNISRGARGSGRRSGKSFLVRFYLIYKFESTFSNEKHSTNFRQFDVYWCYI